MYLANSLRNILHSTSQLWLLCLTANVVMHTLIISDKCNFVSAHTHRFTCCTHFRSTILSLTAASACFVVGGRDEREGKCVCTWLCPPLHDQVSTPDITYMIKIVPITSFPHVLLVLLKPRKVGVRTEHYNLQLQRGDGHCIVVGLCSVTIKTSNYNLQPGSSG